MLSLPSIYAVPQSAARDSWVDCHPHKKTNVRKHVGLVCADALEVMHRKVARFTPALTVEHLAFGRHRHRHCGWLALVARDLEAPGRTRHMISAECVSTSGQSKGNKGETSNTERQTVSHWPHMTSMSFGMF